MSQGPSPFSKGCPSGAWSDKGGDPSSVKFVASIISHRQPGKLANSTLVTVCTARDDNHEQVSPMLRIHIQPFKLFSPGGVTVRGSRRVVHFFVSGDYAACRLQRSEEGGEDVGQDSRRTEPSRDDRDRLEEGLPFEDACSCTVVEEQGPMAQRFPKAAHSALPCTGLFGAV